jgi:hypothetical protein
MTPNRRKNSTNNTRKKYFSLSETAKKLSVTKEILLAWNEQQVFKPAITKSGKIRYTKEQIYQFLEIKNAKNLTRKEDLPKESDEEALQIPLPAQAEAGGTLFERFIEWVGGGFYAKSDIAAHLKSQVNESLAVSMSASYFGLKKPSRIAIGISTGLIVIAALTLFTQQYRIKYMFEQYQDQEGTYEQSLNSPDVLGSHTSKLKLAGSVIFRLPVNLKEPVKIGKTLEVAGESVFQGDITAPNIIYGIRAGENVTITDEASQQPTISVDLTGTISSFQGQTGEIVLEEGDDITIDGLTISNVSTLETVVARGTCADCILDAAVSDSITISSSGKVASGAITGLLTTAVGGTGLNSYVQGDLIYASGSNILENLAIGTQDGQILQVQSGVPVWSSIALNAPGSDALTSGANLVGVFDNLVNTTSNNLQQVLKDLDSSITSAGVSPFTIDTSSYGDYIRPTTSSHHLTMGGDGTPDGARLFFNSSTSNLMLGTNNTGSGGTNGRLTFFSSGNGVTDPYLTTDSTGNLLIPNGNIGVGVTPSVNFRVEVAGHIGPSADATYDLGSASRRFRNLYLSGTTTSDGDITIANVDPLLRFEDTSASEDDFAFSVDNSTFTIQNETQSRNDLVINSSGDFVIAGGAGSTGCTITNSNGNLTCSGNITTTNTSGTVGFFSRNNTTSTISPATSGDHLSTSGNILTTGTGTVTSAGLLTASNGLTMTTGALNLTATSGTLSLSGLSASSINTGSNALTVTSSNFNTTATGINSTAIGATTPSTAAFTTLSSTGATTLGNNTSTVAIDSSSWDISSVGVISGITGYTQGSGAFTVNGSGAVSLGTGTGNVTIGNATGTFSLASSGLNVTTGGALTGVSSINLINFCRSRQHHHNRR